MKKFFLVLLGAVMISTSHAQVLAPNESAMVYYAPQTTVVIDFTYQVENQEAGPYAAFAADLIGATNAVEETKTTYTLTGARVLTRTNADRTRPHKVTHESEVPMVLTINEKGLLVGYNLPQNKDEKMNGERVKGNTSKDECSKKQPSIKVAPYPEEVLKAASPLAQANAIAQQIFHLRETRMYLLSGEVEHAPADGTAMKRVLEELDQQEQALTELFIGKKTTRTIHKEVSFLPDSTEHVWFFSPENGFTDAENLEALPIRVQVALQPQKYAEPAPEPLDKKKKKGETAPALSQIVYNLPGNGVVTVRYNENELAQRTISIAQLGIDVPLPKELFTGDQLPVILFNERTGNIESITK